VDTHESAGAPLAMRSRPALLSITEYIFIGIVIALGGQRNHCAEAIKAPCSACGAIADELERRCVADSSTQKDPLDMRGRIGPQAERFGRVVSWHRSEQRAFSLLEGLCSTARDSIVLAKEHIGGSDDSGKTVLKWTRRGTLRQSQSQHPNEAEARKAMSRTLESHCGKLVEEAEEDLLEALMNATTDRTSFKRIMCGKVCSVPPPQVEERGSADGSSPKAGDDSELIEAEVEDEDDDEHGGADEHSNEERAASEEL